MGMAIDKAIEDLKASKRWKCKPSNECIDIVIKALEQQPCEDWNAVLDELKRIGRNAFKDDTDYDNLFNFISGLPSVQPKPKPKVGHWVGISLTGYTGKDEKLKYNEWGCSECGMEVSNDYMDFDYCPYCGCRMIEPQESEVHDADSN